MMKVQMLQARSRMEEAIRFDLNGDFLGKVKLINCASLLRIAVTACLIHLNGSLLGRKNLEIRRRMG